MYGRRRELYPQWQNMPMFWQEQEEERRRVEAAKNVLNAQTHIKIAEIQQLEEYEKAKLIEDNTTLTLRVKKQQEQIDRLDEMAFTYNKNINFFNKEIQQIKDKNKNLTEQLDSKIQEIELLREQLSYQLEKHLVPNPKLKYR